MRLIELARFGPVKGVSLRHALHLEDPDVVRGDRVLFPFVLLRRGLHVPFGCEYWGHFALRVFLA